MKLVAGYATDVGRVRDGNEDSFVVDGQLALFAVADGMGGHLGGEVASRTAIETLRAAVASGNTIDDAVRRANAAVFERAGTDESLSGMGTTLTALVPGGPAALLFGHVGDSRAYLARGDDLIRLTEDHSLVEELVREGRITEEQAAVHPQRSIITRALGVEPEIDVDLYPLVVATGDRVLLCSDGLTTMIEEAAVQRLLHDNADPQTAAEQLVDAALQAGGTDNVTAVVIDISEVDATGDLDSVAAIAGTAPPATGDATDHTTLLPVVGANDDDPATAVGVDASLTAEIRPGRARRIGRGVFWTAVTVVPIAAFATIGYVVYNNDTPATTTTTVAPSTTAPRTSTTATTTAVKPTTAKTIQSTPSP